MHTSIKGTVNFLTILMMAFFLLAPMTGSSVRGYAIKTYYRIAYDVFGYVDAPKVVSGLDGWLFYKPQFWGGRCLPDEHFAVALNRIDTLEAMAESIGIQLRFSVSPDKFSIYPERLHPRASTYAVCRARNGARWRTLASRRAPNLVDHTPAILTEKEARRRRDDSQLLYLQTDTHWNQSIAPVVVDNLAASLAPELEAQPDLKLVIGGNERPTDLRNRMLLLEHRERVPRSSLQLRRFSRASTDLLIIHDSFYGAIRRPLKSAFPGATLNHVVRDKDKYEAAIRGGQRRIVVNSVEREFFDRFADGLEAPTAQAILKRNMTVAESCSFPAASEQASILTTANVTVRGKRYAPTNADPRIVVERPSPEFNCMRIRLATETPGVFEVYLPNRVGRAKNAAFETGRSFALKLPAGRHDLKFVLPNDLVSSAVRIDPTDVPSEFEIDDVAFGRLPGASGIMTGRIKPAAP